MLDEKAFFATINQVATLSLRTYGMAVKFIKEFSPQAYKNPYFLLTLPPGEKNMEFPENTKIDSHTITIVPRYCETDQAGVVHHTAYPVWFEMGRTELLRANGLAYSKLEKAGICFVVTRLNIKYHSPALYDEKLKLTTTCTNISTARVEHSYCLKRQTTGLLLAEADSTLACVDSRGKVRRMPLFMYPAESVAQNPTKTIS